MIAYPVIKQKQPQNRKTIVGTLSFPVAKILSPVARQAPTKSDNVRVGNAQETQPVKSQVFGPRPDWLFFPWTSGQVLKSTKNRKNALFVQTIRFCTPLGSLSRIFFSEKWFACLGSVARLEIHDSRRRLLGSPQPTATLNPKC